MYKKTGWGFALVALVIAGALYSISQIDVKLGIDLQGGTELVYQLDVGAQAPTSSGTPGGEIAETVKTIIQQRLDSYGLKELSIATQGYDRLVIQIPGVSDVPGIKKQIEEAGIMEFMLEAPSSATPGSRLAKLQAEVRQYNQAESTWYEKFEADPNDASLLTTKPQKGPEWQKLDAEVQAYKRAMRDYEAQRNRLRAEGRLSEAAQLVRPAAPPYNIYPTQELKKEGSTGTLRSHVRPGSYTIVQYEDQYRVDGSLLSTAYRTTDDRLNPAIGFEFNPQGAALFGDLTGNNLDRNLTIVLDNKIIQNANIESRISNRGMISSGSDRFEESYVSSVVNLLRGGSLPTEPLLISESTIGSMISKEAITTGLSAIFVALAIVLVFMLIYYMFGGVVAVIALSLNLVLIWAYVAVFRQTLTLPGIAGVILTIGMAVDANILIFEHVREEINKGKALAAALAAGYKRAFWVIFDSNLTTLITGVILFQFGTGPIKGFAITLIAGIIASFFTAVFVTRLVISFLLNLGVLKNFPMMNLVGVPKIRFQNKRKAFLTLSVGLILASWAIVFYRGEENYGVDFLGGSKITVQSARPISQGDLEKMIQAKKDESAVNQALLNDVLIQSLGSPVQGSLYTRFSVLVRSSELPRVADAQESGEPAAPAPTSDPAPTPVPGPTPEGPEEPEGGEEPTAVLSETARSLQAARERESQESANQERVRELLTEILRENGLLLEEPFPPVDPASSERRGRWISAAPAGPGEAFQIRANLLDLGSADPAKDGRQALEDLLNAHLAVEFPAQQPVEGVVIPNPFPGISATVQTVETKTLPGSEGVPGRVLTTVEIQTTGYIEPSSELSKVSATPTHAEVETSILKFFRGEADVFETVARNFNLSEPFPEIVTIGSRVANNLHQQAFVAFFLAVIAIIFYLSLRFELAFGLGAITALIHDVLVAVGILALTDFIFGKTLSFKINLPEVAALLTIIGYSVNDTIVVFDRIRENLRESARTDDFEALVDKSINQTLSRTIWTSITTMIVILALLIFGGESVRGFAFTFAVGLITGTYSSIFVASPALMYFRKRAQARRERIKAEAAAG